MKKILLLFLVFCLSFTTVSCSKTKNAGSLIEQYKVVAQKYIDNGDVETAINALKEGITITGDADLKAMLAELEAKNQGTNTKMEPNTEAAPTNQTVDLLPSFSYDERKALNVFLSNFSEAYFSSYNQTDYTNEQLISFAFTHNNTNNPAKIKYLESEMGISFQDVNTTLERYLGKSIPAASVGKWTYVDGFFYTPAATGESYATFSIATSLTQNPDGTLDVSFSVFFDEKNAFEIALPEWYSYTIEQAERLCTKQENGTAKIRPKNYNGSATYELVTYNLQKAQTDGVPTDEKSSKKEAFLTQAQNITQYTETHLDTAITQLDMNNESGVVYEKWDALLNEVYQYLKSILPEAEFSNLQTDEINWISEKERAVAEAEAEWGNGTGRIFARNSTAIQFTQERCYYLINLIQ